MKKPKTIKPPKTVIVKRRDWIRGESKDYDKITYLRRTEDKKMCCLGFLSRQAGLSTREINDVVQPQNLTRCITGLSKIVKCDGGYDLDGTQVGDQLMNANDCASLDDKTREKKIKALGKKIGVTFKFVD